MIPSQRCADLVAQFEGYKATAYRCPANVWTIGHGTTHYPNGAPVKEGDTCTEAQANAWLLGELEEMGAKVTKLVKTSITQNQFDALCSFAYNVGAGALSSSTLLKKLNAGDYQGAADQFPLWNKGGGKVLPGLVKRRAAERELFLEA